ncbi:MAG TPA: hypothetical protein VMH32_04330 [Burkholderiales bacterium]|nr:hypothetical protein [Burkholderiales bacterium]
MSMTRFIAFAVAVAGATSLFLTTDACAQTKYSISRPPATTSSYPQQLAMDVGDVSGHQVRVYQLHFEYPNRDLAFAGVLVKESEVYGFSDYTNFSGPFWNYQVYTLEDGSKVFSRSSGTSQATTKPDGSRVVKYSYVENFVGGTGRFKGIRGQTTGSGERGTVAKSVTEDKRGEYWIED